MQKSINIINNFKGKKIGVIGDLMLDQFVFGHVHRISPEAPVPVVLFSNETYILGGAANVAHNIISLGGEVFLIGAVGTDVAGNHFINQMKICGVDTSKVIAAKNRVTTQKIRVVAHGQHIVRVDKEVVEEIDKKTELKILDMIISQMRMWDIVVISDYNKGCVTKNIVLQIMESAKKHGKKIIADIKPEHMQYYKNIFLVTPNQQEAFLMAQINDPMKAGRKIQESLKCNVLMKRGAHGMILFGPGKSKSFPVRAKEVFDVSGAGDTVLAVMALAISSGATLEESAAIANHAAGISVGKVGTAVVFPNELLRELNHVGKEN